MMGLSDGRKSFPIGLAVLIQYRSVTDTHPARHVAVGITLKAKASSLKITLYRFNQGGYTIAGGSNGSGGLSPLTLTTA